MSDKVFIDSNILIYAYSIDEPAKQKIVDQLLDQYQHIIISTQTINEFINVALKKKKLNHQQISLAIKEFFSIFSVEIINAATIQKAIEISHQHHYSYFDSLIIASAIITQCSLLYTEDMHHQHTIEQITIINPFKKTNF